MLLLLSARLHALKPTRCVSVESRRTTRALNHVHSIDASAPTRQSVALPGPLFFRNRCRHCVARLRAFRSECSRNCDRVQDRFADQQYPRADDHVPALRSPDALHSLELGTARKSERSFRQKHQLIVPRNSFNPAASADSKTAGSSRTGFRRSCASVDLCIVPKAAVC